MIATFSFLDIMVGYIWMMSESAFDSPLGEVHNPIRLAAPVMDNSVHQFPVS
jgi:hypothetical protein